MLLAAALLGAAAILIAEGRLGLLDVHDVVRYSQADLDFDNIVRDVAGWLGVALLVAGILYLRSSRGGRVRGRVWSVVERLLVGAAALRSGRALLTVALLTAAGFATAVAMFAIVAGAAGLSLSIAQSALVMGGLALSTSIPAAPGSLGTYEFVGLSLLTALGVDAEVALAVVVLVHLVVTLPVALAGLVAAWRLHFRVSEIARDVAPGEFVGVDAELGTAG